MKKLINKVKNAVSKIKRTVAKIEEKANKLEKLFKSKDSLDDLIKIIEEITGDNE